MIAELVVEMIRAASVDLVARRYAGKLAHLIVGEDAAIYDALVELGAVRITSWWTGETKDGRRPRPRRLS